MLAPLPVLIVPASAVLGPALLARLVVATFNAPSVPCTDCACCSRHEQGCNSWHGSTANSAANDTTVVEPVLAAGASTQLEERLQRMEGRVDMVCACILRTYVHAHTCTACARTYTHTHGHAWTCTCICTRTRTADTCARARTRTRTRTRTHTTTQVVALQQEQAKLMQAVVESQNRLENLLASNCIPLSDLPPSIGVTPRVVDSHASVHHGVTIIQS